MRAFLGSWKNFSGRVITFAKRRPILKASAAAGGLVVGQLAYLQSTYVPLKPPIDAVTSGMAIWCDKEGARVVADSHGHTADKIPSDRPKKRVLIIGDSLAVGIGCKHENILPQVLCQKLSEQLKVDISWYIHGINGADIRTLHNDTLRRFREHQPQLYRMLTKVIPNLDRRSSESSVTAVSAQRPCVAQMAADADIIVIMCGLNDLKRLLLGRTVAVFRRDLDDFLLLLRERTSSDCLMVLPALPMELTRLPQPLKSIAIWLGGAFDVAKRDAAAADACARFIPKPSAELWRQAEQAVAAEDRTAALAAGGGGAFADDSHDVAGGGPPIGLLLARDGVHPNEAGYTAFAEYLSKELTGYIRRHPSAGSPESASTVQRRESEIGRSIATA